MAGITENGLIIKTFEDINNELAISEKSYIDPDLDTTTETVVGQFNAIVARGEALVWQALQICYNQMNPDAAEGVLLENLCKLTGITRFPATYSTVSINCTFKFSGVLLQTDIHFVSSTQNNSIKFTPITDYVSPIYDGNGDPYVYPPTGLTFPVLFRCAVTGPIDAGIGTLNSIATPVSGWLSATNNEAAIIGSVRESDESLRARRADSVSITGASTVDAIRADIIALNQQNDAAIAAGGYVISCTVYEATTLPTFEVPEAHSFKALIYDQGVTPEWDNLLAQTIWNGKPAGIKSLGDDSGTAIDTLGVSHTIEFQRVTDVPIYIKYTLTWEGEEPDETELANQLTQILQAKYQPGDDINALYVNSLPLQFSNITDVTVFGIGLGPAPVGTTNIPIAYDEIGTFDPGRITITLVP